MYFSEAWRSYFILVANGKEICEEIVIQKYIE